MAANVTVGTEEITVTLSGLTALQTFRRSVHIPLAAIKTIRSEGAAGTGDQQQGNFEALTGIRSGIVKRDGRKVLLAHQSDRPTLTLELDRDAYPDVGFDTVILAADHTAISLAG